jgi:multidrug transporter EmrE-like cation transporter
MNLASGWLLLLFAAVANAAANLLLKRSATGGTGEGVAQYLTSYFLVGVALFAVNVLLYAKALQGIAVSIAYPILVGVGAVIVVVGSGVVFKESVSAAQLLGIGFIVAGVALIGR